MAALLNLELLANGLTEKTVTANDIFQATAFIAAYTGIDLLTGDGSGNERSDFTKADANNLSYAIAYQAVYQVTNPDLANKSHALTGASTNGVSVSYSPTAGATGDVLLAPLAARCLARLSRNKRYRTIHAVPERLAHLDVEETGWKPLVGVWTYRR